MAATKIKHRRTSNGSFVRQVGLSSPIGLIEKGMQRDDFPDFGPGDTLKVHVRIKEGEKERIQIFEGTVIKESNRGVNRSFTIRKISHGVGVERIFLKSSPKISKLELVSEGRVRRAKLYYLSGLEGKAARVERKIDSHKQVKAKATPIASA